MRPSPVRNVLQHAVAVPGNQAQPVRPSESLSDPMSSSHQPGIRPRPMEASAGKSSSKHCSPRHWSRQRIPDKSKGPHATCVAT